MSSASDMKELLRPLGVYQLEESFLGTELDCLGGALDQAQEWLEEIQREMSLVTARGDGLERMAELFVSRPVTDDPEQLAASLAALTRIGADSFTLAAVRDTIAGCGLNVVVSEADEPNTVVVRFPEVKGIPDRFERLRTIIEDILPAHVRIQYLFWYQTWSGLEELGLTWQAVEEQGMTWSSFETLVE